MRRGLEVRCRAEQLQIIDGSRLAIGVDVEVKTGLFAGLIGHIVATEGDDRYVVLQGLRGSE